MNDLLLWLYLVNAVLLINHEIDSAYWKEWQLFKLPGDITGFLLIHFPLLILILDGQFSRRSRHLRIVGPPGLTRRVTEAMEIFFPGLSRTRRKFETEFIELDEGVPTAVGPWRVTPYEVVHACGAPPYALRVEIEGRTIVYSGDTEWTDRLIPAAAGADLVHL